MHFAYKNYQKFCEICPSSYHLLATKIKKINIKLINLNQNNSAYAMRNNIYLTNK